MHSRDALGTSAAQVAAASRDSELVARVAGLLTAELDAATPVLPRDRAKRAVELADALGTAGEAARPHVAVVVRLLERQVDSAAPPFGVVQRTPNEACRALQAIGGPQAERALSGPRCEKPWFGMPS